MIVLLNYTFFTEKDHKNILVLQIFLIILLPCQVEQGLELLYLLHLPEAAGGGRGGGVQPAVQHRGHLSKVHSLIDVVFIVSFSCT